MEQEDVLMVIDKLNEAGITLNALEEIKPLIGTADFMETYEIVQGIEVAIQPLGRLELKNDLIIAAKEYHNEEKIVQLRKINRFVLPAIAAIFMIVCSVTIIQALTDYNSPKNYRKVYSEKLK